MKLYSVNPATEDILFEHPVYNSEKIELLLQQAQQAYLINRERDISKRCELLLNLSNEFEAHLNELAELATLEMGKPISQAKAEVSKCSRAAKYYASCSPDYLKDELIDPKTVGASKAYIKYEPLGVILGIMPWNFPYWQVIRFALPTLAAGNSVVVKHASNVPQIALKLEEIFRNAGFSNNEFLSLLVTSEDIKDVISHPNIAGVSLTGSESAGKAVALKAAEVLKPVVLELGGSDSFIVTNTADLNQAVDTAIIARLQNNSQSCIAAKRFILQKDIKERFIQLLIMRLESLKIGDPLNEDTLLGPLATKQVLQDANGQLEDAISKGAKVVYRGECFSEKGYYFAPLVLDDITPEMRIYHEEVFAPIFQIYEAEDLNAAVKIANSTNFGLGASCFCNSEDETQYAIDKLASGMVFINGMTASYPQLPFGGIKHSGIGRELGYYGLRSFCNIKTVWVG